MFRSRLNAFRQAPPRPPLCHPACPELRRERSEGAAFLHPLTPPDSYASQALLCFYTTTLLRTHSNARNSNPLIRLLHNCLHTPGVGSVLSTTLSFSLSHAEVSFTPRWFHPILEQALTTNRFRIRTYAKHTRIPFGIRTSKTQDLKSFRIRTYKKNRGGGSWLGSDLRSLHLSTFRRS